MIQSQTADDGPVTDRQRDAQRIKAIRDLFAKSDPILRDHLIMSGATIEQATEAAKQFASGKYVASLGGIFLTVQGRDGLTRSDASGG